MRTLACAALAAAAALLAAPAARAQLELPAPRPIVGARVPALSPDGKRLAFVYRGDVWVADATGGRATALTRNTETDSYPQFSPDGNWLAFASTRNGNWDLYVVPAVGGTPRRLTWHSGSDIAYGWSPDGRSLLFTGRRETGDAELLSLDVRSLRVRRLAQDYNDMAYANWSPDSRTVVFGSRGFPWTRPRYNGSAAMQVVLLDAATGKRRQITDDGRQHLWPRFLPDGRSLLTVTVGEVTPSAPRLNEKAAKFVDSPARTPNLWFFDLQGRGRQVTRFVGGSVRWPTVAARSGDIAFEYGHDLYLLRPGQKEAAPVALYASEDAAQNPTRHETLTSGADEAEPSPDGKTYAFAVRGDIWTVPIERPKGAAAARGMEIARRLTDWVGADYDFVWAKDGKRMWYRSDRDYVTRLYEVDPATLQTRSLWTRSEDAGQLHLSPDGKEIAFWVSGAEGGLYIVTPADGKARRVMAMPDAQREWQSGGDFTWSPDMKWYAFTVGELAGGTNIWIMPAAGGEPVNVTRLNAWHGMPTWTPDGKYLLFSSDRDGSGLYALPLTKEAAPTGEVDVAFEKPKDPVKVDIDFADITRRIRKLNGQSPQADLTAGSDGTVFFVSEGDVWSVTYDGKEAKRLTTGGGCGALRVAPDAKKLFFSRNGELFTMKLEGSNPQEKVTFTVDFDRDIRAERQAAFTQFWSAYNTRFYDPNMHGRDWVAVRKRYEPMLEGVETRGEFANVLSMMVGELEASHSEVGAAPGGNPSPTTPHLGFTLDYTYEGPGIRVAQVPPGAPGSFAKTLIKPGEYVMAINGQDVTLDENLYRTINDRQGRPFEFLVNSKPSKEGARTVRYVSMTYGEWGDLRYRNRVERLRKYVEDKTGGKVSYVHIAGMGGGNQVTLERELYEYALGKKAMIIDVRFNGGGNISDNLINWLERKPHGYYRPRDGLAEPAPGRAWTKPTVVLMNEHSFSNAEMFPAAMRARGLAKLVGMPTPGYVIWTWGLPLVDGTSGRMPGSGVYRVDGTPMEDLGEKPDVEVPLTADDWLAERDPQLDRAIEMLSK